jgi:hypothetical protein
MEEIKSVELKPRSGIAAILLVSSSATISPSIML